MRAHHGCAMASSARIRSAAPLFAFALATFAGALLFLQVQPLVGRVLLPQLGGTPGVWITCLAFFQLTLFLGYVATHWTARLLSLRQQVVVQVVLLAIVLERGPLELPAIGSAQASAAPVRTLLGFLFAHAGSSCVALAMTSPLLQSWYAAATGREPYALYAVSNAGSMLGVLGYPLLIERRLGLGAQRQAFGYAFTAYATIMLVPALFAWRAAKTRDARARVANTARASISQTDALTWLALSVAPSALLVAISNHVSVDVPSTPLLWAVPLALYLGSFMLAFSGAQRHYAQFHAGLWIACTVALPVLLMPGNATRLPIALGVPFATLWAGAMLCHGMLARRRPDPSRLTVYYVCIAGGGALGGGLVAFVAPFCFADLYELTLSMLAIHGLQLLLNRRRDARSAPSGPERLAWIGGGLALPVLGALLWVQIAGLGRGGHVLARARNFYGPVQVIDTDGSRVLAHGRTDQGRALRAPARTNEPVGYVGPETAVGRALTLHAADRPRALGVLGLGIGALAAYAKAGDVLRFYEINPLMLSLAQRWFTFLARTPATWSVTPGDGRLALAREPVHAFDVFVVDAFSSDAVPQHLLTREAFGVYLRQLAPDGVLTINVSNRSLSIERVVAGSAASHGLACVVLESAADPARGWVRSRWALIARRPALLTPMLGGSARPLEIVDPVLFTDDHASLWSIAR
jgi:hypothetical protein